MKMKYNEQICENNLRKREKKMNENSFFRYAFKFYTGFLFVKYIKILWANKHLHGLSKYEANIYILFKPVLLILKKI